MTLEFVRRNKCVSKKCLKDCAEIMTAACGEMEADDELVQQFQLGVLAAVSALCSITGIEKPTMVKLTEVAMERGDSD